jgi:hypothetical protein
MFSLDLILVPVERVFISTDLLTSVLKMLDFCKLGAGAEIGSSFVGPF